MGAYADEYRRSMEDPTGFWAEQAAAIDWVTPPERVLDDARAPLYSWFPDAELNTCVNAVDRHVAAGRGDQIAVIHDSAITGEVQKVTYRELQDRVARFAGALAALGVAKGDRVVVYLPMITEAVIAMLACARLGAVHSVVFGGFAAPELAARLDDARPKVIVTASCGLEAAKVLPYLPIVHAAIDVAVEEPEAVVVLQRPQLRADLGRLDVDWEDAVAHAAPAEPVPVQATDPLYILYTSGTTGRPKGVVRDNGGHAVALAYSMRAVYDVRPGEVWWTASDVGWVVGHSYIVYAPLLIGATTVVYEGKPVGTPDAGAFWRVVERHRVVALFTAPTALRAIRKEDPEAELLARSDTSTLRTLFMAGERLDPDTYAWASEKLGVPVVDHWWQTETGWPVSANLRGLEPMPIKPGSSTVPVPGYGVRIVDDRGTEAEAGAEGAVVISLPMPPGTLATLWGDDQRFIDSYLSTFDGYYLTGDGGYIDSDGYLFVMGRTDDVMNVAGHRLSTGSMEAVIASHPAVAECAVIGVADPLKGQVPRALVVLKAGVAIDPDTLCDEVVARVRDTIGAVAALREVVVVQGLPKTRSGKILRRSMRALAEGRNEAVPSTIEDPAVLESLRGTLSP
ncbi:acetate--CoA ligase [Tsukamurella sp. 8F]|uniref:acetate--CoA ligase n=1 Tax=unclassified Tsukamurella TaxID=2633480 RepID=UPI0023B9AF85|nr:MULTISPECIES: acetate--CoA ligase [unclassified Tsukamurella]MDF0532020.1 acetate--CoA ligase [Tsukamurella sp. 8J]MDF0588425.1 acetate--CoA ligase [Tsukamurella sp. 8F]